MDVIIGIDLGTTNSEVAVVQQGQPVMLSEDGDPILPSVVGLDPTGKLLVGRAARNQFVLAPERTVRSIKRKMGQEVMVSLGTQSYRPQEISAMILRTLKVRAERALGHPVSKAVITVPAFFTEGQREATRQAGDGRPREWDHQRTDGGGPHHDLTHRDGAAVHDLGGTFDVSIAMVESGVVDFPVTATPTGGDD